MPFQIEKTGEAMISFLVFIFIMATSQCQNQNGIIEMTNKIIDVNHIQSLSIYSCGEKDAVEFFTYFNSKNVFVSVKAPVKVISPQYYRQAVFVDLNCDSNHSILDQTNDEIWGTNFLWILTFKGEVFPHIGKLGLFSDVWLVSWNATQKLYNTRKGTQIRGVELEKGSETDVRKTFDGEPITGSIFFVQDIFDRSKLEEQIPDHSYKPNFDPSNRYFYVVTLHLAQLFNFSLNLIVADIWGEKLKNGSWNGMLGHLERGEAEFAITPFVVLPERLEVGHHTVSIQNYWMAFVFKQPRALGTYKALLLEFTPLVWVSVFLTIVAGAFVYCLMMLSDVESDEVGPVSASLLQLIGVFTFQGLSLNPFGTSSRFACFTMLIASTLLINYYNAATLTSLLSSSPPTIRSPRDLFNSKIPLNLIDAAYFRTKSARSRILRPEILSGIDSKPHQLLNLNEGLDQVRRGAALIGDSSFLFQGINDAFKESDKCDLSVIPAGAPSAVAMYTSKNLHTKEMFARGLLRSWEHGIMSRERHRWIASRPKCLGSTQFIFVTLEAVSLAFGVFTVGFITAALIFLVELLINRK